MIAEVVFLEMGEKFVENNFFKDLGQKWKVRNSDFFFNRGLTTAVFRSHGIMPVVRDVLMMFMMVGKRMSRF